MSQDNRHIQAWSAPQGMTAAKDLAGHLPRLPKGHQGRGLTLAISLDGQTLASSDRTPDRTYIKVWDLATGRLQRTLPGHRKAIHALTLGADGQLLLAAATKLNYANE